MSWWIFPSEAVTAFAALVGAALGAFLTHWFSRNRDHLQVKRDVLRRLLGYRWQLTEGHYAWLLGRDLTNLSFALLIASAGLAGALQVGGWGWIVLVSAQGLLYIVLSQVAANKGIRFVTTVLAEAVASG